MWSSSQYCIINPCLCLNYNGKTNYSKLLRDKLCNIEIWREEVLAASETMLTQLKLLAVWLIFITAGANAMASVTAPKAGHHDTFQTLCEIFRDQGVWPIPPDEALGAAGIYKSNQSTWIGCYSHQQLVCCMAGYTLSLVHNPHTKLVYEPWFHCRKPIRKLHVWETCRTHKVFLDT